MMKLDRLVFVAVASLLVAGLGCDRSPEDLEQWRNAKGGMEKMQTWASSPDEPMPVRVRAIQIMIEEHAPTTLEPTFKEISDGEARQKLVAGGVETIEKMWGTQDMPSMDDTNKAGKVELKESEAVKAKDAAFFLVAIAEGDNKTKLQGILDQWLSKDWKLRGQLGKTDLAQILPRASDEGAEQVLQWLKETKDPYKVSKLLRENTDVDLEDKIGEILVERTEKEHPELSDSLLSAIVNSKSDKVVPYLKKAIRDSESTPTMVDQSMEALKNIRGERAATFFTEIIKEEKGKLRWAAVNDLIDIRGKGGILAAATSLPLEKDTYAHPEDDSFKKDAQWFANFVVGEMEEADITTLSGTLTRALESDRWPVQVLGLTTTQAAHQKNLLGEGRSDVRDAVNKLTSSRSDLPGWGESKRMGELAHETLDVLESESKK